MIKYDKLDYDGNTFRIPIICFRVNNMIKVISQSTAERKQETADLYNQCKTYMDEGYSFTKAVMKAKGITYYGFRNQAWYKELKKYRKEVSE